MLFRDIISCVHILIFQNCIFLLVSSHASEASASWLSSSLFESLRELIYSEVASLISQNEMRPHYLVDLFRRLRLLTTDDQRRQLMATLEQLVADYLTDSDEQPANVVVLHRARLQRSVSYSFYCAAGFNDN